MNKRRTPRRRTGVVTKVVSSSPYYKEVTDDQGQVHFFRNFSLNGLGPEFKEGIEVDLEYTTALGYGLWFATLKKEDL
jgi:hypothetical protein